MSKMKAATSGTVVTGTLVLNSKPLSVLFDSSATHSFISIRVALQLSLKSIKVEANYRIKLPIDSIVECPILYKQVPITIGGTTFPGDLIRFGL